MAENITVYDPVLLAFRRTRGDTKPYRFLRKVNGVALDLSGYTYTMTGDPSPAPPDNTTKVFQLTASGNADGTFTFSPGDADVDLLGRIYIDVQEKDAAGDLLTVGEGYIRFVQDKSKTT